MFTVTELKNIIAFLHNAVVKGVGEAEVLLGLHSKAAAAITTIETTVKRDLAIAKADADLAHANADAIVTDVKADVAEVKAAV